ncbi:DNA polymerase III subunit delta [Legionella dresdenensis]|uniref:DNA polymerase III subunit delta n=1 Tax=Legionella dresdenensis TaxID=450200 RepID=A0ABV8CBE3_9GAMM
MLIRQANLNFSIGNKLPAVLFLTGQQPYQLNRYADMVKTQWFTLHPGEAESKTIYLNNASDWLELADEANSYSLFASRLLLDVRYDKKTLEAAGKTFLDKYLSQINPDCLLLFRAPELPAKAMQAFANHNAVHVVTFSAPDKNTVIRWLDAQLKQHYPAFDQAIPALIYQYNEGNLLGCAQIIEKLALIIEPGQPLTSAQVTEHLILQCDYLPFELADACLEGNTQKTIQLIRHAQANKTEATLILWILTQEVRQLIQLQHLAKSGSFREAASQLKIWAQKIGAYQNAASRLNQNLLVDLLRFCNTIDGRIKTSQNKPIWPALELIGLTLCIGKQVGCLA